jgi:uncharacterized membrane protein
MSVEETENETKAKRKEISYQILPIGLIILLVLDIILIIIFGMNIVLTLILIFLSVILVGTLFTPEVIEVLKDLFSKRR